jgi:peptide/nickel transport system permease protein
VIRYTANRILGALGVLLVVSVVTFAIFQLLPRVTKVDMAFYYTGRNTSAAQAAAVAERFGFDKPVWTQYWTWLSGIFTGRDLGDGVSTVHCAAPCLGWSFRQNRSVTEMLLQAFPVTASIVLGAAVLWLVGGVATGVLAAARRGSFFDRGSTVISLLGVSIPEFFSGMLVIYALTAGPSWLRWYSGGITYVPFTENPLRWAGNLIPVWVCLAFLIAAVYTRWTRAAMLETMSEDFITTARAKGLRRRTVVGRHGLRAVIPSVVTLAGLDLGALLGGVIIVESLFSFPGLGRLAYDGITTKDLPVIMGTTLFAAVLIVVANVIVDACYAVLDPRVRHAH